MLKTSGRRKKLKYSGGDGGKREKLKRKCGNKRGARKGKTDFAGACQAGGEGATQSL